MLYQEEISFSRKEVLSRYNILDTMPEQNYDDLITLVASICQTPIALLSFLEEERQWFKSSLGLSLSETLLQDAFCLYTVNTKGKILIVEDAREDVHFKNNPYVTGDPNFVFYAGVALIDKDGFTLGIVCVLDIVKRTLTPEQINALYIISRQIMNLLELRKISVEHKILQAGIDKKNEDCKLLRQLISQSFKGPLSNIIGCNEQLKNDYSIIASDENSKIVNTSIAATGKMKELVDSLSHLSKKDSTEDNFECIDLSAFFAQLQEEIGPSRHVEIGYARMHQIIYSDKITLTLIFNNLVRNSIQYNDNSTISIEISFEETDESYNFLYTDNSRGIAKEDQELIFELFSHEKHQDSFGLGLPATRLMIENAGGRIDLYSEPGKGVVYNFAVAK